MSILLNKISTKGGRGGQKSPKSCLHRKWMPPNDMLKVTAISAMKAFDARQ